MSHKEPGYFVQTPDGRLHAYWSVDILCCDLAQFGSSAVIHLYEKEPGVKLRYRQMDIEKLGSLKKLREALHAIDDDIKNILS